MLIETTRILTPLFSFPLFGLFLPTAAGGSTEIAQVVTLRLFLLPTTIKASKPGNDRASAHLRLFSPVALRSEHACCVDGTSLVIKDSPSWSDASAHLAASAFLISFPCPFPFPFSRTPFPLSILPFKESIR